MSWEQYLSLLRTASEEAQAKAAEPPKDCPRCGKPFTSGPNGERHCTFDGYIWDGQPVTYG